MSIKKIKEMAKEYSKQFKETNCYQCNNWNKDKNKEISGRKCLSCKQLKIAISELK